MYYPGDPVRKKKQQLLQRLARGREQIGQVASKAAMGHGFGRPGFRGVPFPGFRPASKTQDIHPALAGLLQYGPGFQRAEQAQNQGMQGSWVPDGGMPPVDFNPMPSPPSPRWEGTLNQSALNNLFGGVAPGQTQTMQPFAPSLISQQPQQLQTNALLQQLLQQYGGQAPVGNPGGRNWAV